MPRWKLKPMWSPLLPSTLIGLGGKCFAGHHEIAGSCADDDQLQGLAGQLSMRCESRQLLLTSL